MVSKTSILSLARSGLATDPLVGPEPGTRCIHNIVESWFGCGGRLVPNSFGARLGKRAEVEQPAVMGFIHIVAAVEITALGYRARYIHID